MTKTTEEITALRDAIRAEVDRLPPRNVFGESNAEDIQAGEKYIQDLNRLLEGKSTLGAEVESWYEGPDDWFLKDWAG